MTDVSVSDQYSDGVAAKVWEYYIGNTNERTEVYREWLVNLLCKHECKHVLDVACGTGIDSVMLLNEGFRVTSCDGSDKMVIKAFREQWKRRREPAFDDWEIDVANWLTLEHDIAKPGEGFDAIICIGNSFAHLPDFDGKQSSHRLAITNFAKMLKPGGVMIIDHRNYDAILDTGKAPAKNIYYHGNCIKDIITSTTFINGKPGKVVLDYFIDTSMAKQDRHKNLIRQNCVQNGDTDHAKRNGVQNGDTHPHHTKHQLHGVEDGVYRFQLSYFPHRLNDFTGLLTECFGDDITHTVYGDYKPKGEIDTPAYYIHVIEKHS